MITQVGYEIDNEGNVGNETTRIEDLSLRFVILVMVIQTRIEDLETKTKMTERAVKTCHKETGVPISELASLLVRMTKEIKEITDNFEKNFEDWQDFFKKNFKIYFEFSSIPCDGGFIAPHTDSPSKIITCVMPIIDKEEISNLKGIGTSMLEATNIKYKYNYLNQTVPLSDTREIKYIDFLPNQMLMFIKTHNSLHCVGPIESTSLTKSLNRKSINVCIVKE